MTHLLEVNELTVCAEKNKKQFKIIDDVSFYINEGEITGLAGESGSGKTITALSILNLLPVNIKITKGNIIFNNQSLFNLKENRIQTGIGSGISAIFQDARSALNPIMKSGRQITEVLELERKQAGIKLQFSEKRKQREKDRETALEILSSLGFSNPQKVFNAYPHQLSGGMCQRVMTAVAAIGNPKLLIGDEPSSSLDDESQNRSLSYLMEMNRVQKTSLLLISHDLSIIQKYCERYIIMYGGKIIEEGPSSALFSPLHPYTQALINAIPNKEKRGEYLKSIKGKSLTINEKFSGCPFFSRCDKAKDVCKDAFPPKKEINSAKVFCHFPKAAGDTA